MCSTYCVCMFLCLLYAPSHQKKNPILILILRTFQLISMHDGSPQGTFQVLHLPPDTHTDMLYTCTHTRTHRHVIHLHTHTHTHTHTDTHTDMHTHTQRHAHTLST